MKSQWRKYNGALIPLSPPHIKVDSNNISQKLVAEKAYFARWTSDFDSKIKSNFWYVICDKKMDFNHYSRSTRSKIRRAYKRLYVKQISRDVIIDTAYSVYKRAFTRYEASSSPKSLRKFKKNLSDLDGNWHFWGIFCKESDQLVGYSQNKIINDYCDYSTIKFDPRYLRFYSSYILYYEMNKYYLNENSFKYVNIGARSLIHKTNTQKHLIEKFGFRKSYCNLHLEYRFFIGFIVRVLYKFRFVFKYFKWNFIINKIYGLLLHEEIKRTFSSNIIDKVTPIIVIGAARSGTHLIASTIKKNIDCIYFNEVNDLWKKRYPFLDVDEIEGHMVNEEKVGKVRRDFSNLIKKRPYSPFFLEKTASNCLRLDLVKRVFPNAKFIHIIRDGRDVAVSTRKKYFGDIRKISSNNNNDVKSKNRFFNFFYEVNHKIKNGLTLLMLISNTFRYLRMSLVILGLKNRDFWGPRFKGYKKIYNSCTLIDVAAQQWRYSVESILDFFKKNPNESILTINYEDLISHPDREVLKTINFVLDDKKKIINIVHDIKTTGFKKWDQVLDTEEIRVINNRMLGLLRKLNYE
tara:strand:- start:10401 stop:12128 length:1728 start_codon:yes stop_codon:yes gene_type:complete